ncbi:Serpin domain-containing protein [Baffinella frigidus]|nr:Serpin domain-containing protein [Cryptophyta sp. CCMP2293]
MSGACEEENKSPNPVTVFGSALFTTKLAENSENETVVLSPWSIWTALSMAEMASVEGSLASEELRKLLQYDLVCGDVHDWFKKVHSMLVESDSKVSLQTANAIFVDDQVKDNFKAECLSTFSAEVMRLQDGCAGINTFVSDKTGNMIKQIVSRKPDGPAVLVNAVYFRGSWAKKFDKTDTRDDTFTTFANQLTKCKMMKINQHMQYIKTKKLTMVELDYGDTRQFAAFIAVPTGAGAKSMQEAVEELFGTEDAWDNVTSQMQGKTIELSLPRFNADSNGTTDLKGTIEKMGAKEVF